MRPSAVALAGAAVLLCACGTALGDPRSDTSSDVIAVGVTGEPHAARTYTQALPLLDAQPTRWGGAYVGDDGWLVVKYVGQSASEAQRALTGQGVKGGYKLMAGTVSQAALFEQLELVTTYMKDHQDGRITQAGPDYKDSALVIGLNDDDGSTESAIRGLLKGAGPTPLFEAASPVHLMSADAG
jgi:hypothetical protein